MRREELGKLFRRPAGGSELFSIGNTSHGTTSAIVCELCGTLHPERHPNDDSYRTFTLFGRMGVLECCGSVMDGLYREWGQTFTSRRLDEFRQSPLDRKFGLLRIELQNAINRWARMAEKATSEAAATAAAVPT